MKKNQNNDHPPIPISAEVCDICGFGSEGALGLYAGRSALVAMKDCMTALEVAYAIDTLSKMASDLTVVLAKAGGICDGCDELNGKSPAEGVADCSLCRDIFDVGRHIQIPDYLMEEAHIPKGTKLEAYVEEDGGIVVERAEIQSDITNLPPSVVAVLTASGVCLAALDECVIEGNIIYGE